MTATFACTGPQTVAPKGPAHMVLFSWRGIWMIFFVLELLHIRVYKNTNDSNFCLYGAPDSSPEGPDVPQLVYSAEKVHGWIFLYWNYYTLGCTKIPMTATFACTGPQTVAAKARPVSSNWLIELHDWIFLHWDYHIYSNIKKDLQEKKTWHTTIIIVLSTTFNVSSQTYTNLAISTAMHTF